MGTLTGTYLLPDGTPETGTVTFRLTARVVNADVNIYTEGPIPAVLDETGSFSVDLVAVDDPGLSVEGTLSYEVVEHVTSRPSTAYYITPLGDGPWQIEDLAWYDAPPDVAVIPVPGPQGEKGDKGDPGIAATVDAGTTTTGPPGSQASVVNSGNTTAAVFNFTVPQGPTGLTGPPGPAGGTNSYGFNWGGTAIADPGTGRIAVNGTGNSPRVLSISKTDADGNDLNLLLLLPGDTITITDDPGGPITGWARYALTGDPIDQGTWVRLDAIRTDASGTPTPPPLDTRLRVIASLASGGNLYPLRDEVNVLPLAQVATWSALPPATAADVGRRIRVTGPGGWLVATVIADPTPRWSPAADSDTGWRVVSADLINGWTQSLLIRRTGNLVTAHGYLTGTGASAVDFYAVPPGFASNVLLPVTTAVRVNTHATYIVRWSGSGLRMTDLDSPTTWPALSNLAFSLSWPTNDAWPTTLPGTPA